MTGRRILGNLDWRGLLMDVTALFPSPTASLSGHLAN